MWEPTYGTRSTICADCTRLDRCEQHSVVVPLPEELAATPQRFELGMRELRAELALPGAAA